MPKKFAANELKPASFLRRLLALGIDFVILFGIFQLVLILLGLGVLFFFFKDYIGSPELLMGAMFFDSTRMMYWAAVAVGVWVLLTMAVVHVYFIVLESKQGASLGKRFCGLKVVTLDGLPISSKQAVLRDLGRWYVDFVLVLPTIVSVVVTKRRQRIGDLMAGTMVVHQSTLTKLANPHLPATPPEHSEHPEQANLPAAQPLPQAPVPLMVPETETPLARYLRKQETSRKTTDS